MDKESKSLLQYLISHGGGNKFVTFSSGLESLASDLCTDSESLRKTVRYLHEIGYIDYQYYSGTDRVASFSLSHKGKNWKYFQRRAFLDYLADKWIDFFASIISVLSLVVSIIALLSSE